MLRLQISLLVFILNGKTKTKLAILAFLCWGEFVKTSSSLCRNRYTSSLKEFIIRDFQMLHQILLLKPICFLL